MNARIVVTDGMKVGIKMTEISAQLDKVELLAEVVKKAPIHKTKKAAVVLGEESLKLSRLLVDDNQALRQEFKDLTKRLWNLEQEQD